MSDSSNQQTQLATKRSGLKKTIILFLMLILLIIIAAFAVCYVKLEKTNRFLAKNINILQQQSDEHTHTLTSLAQTVTNLQTSFQKSQALADEQQQLVNDWHKAEQGDLSKWHVAEARYLVNLANQQLDVSHDTKLATTLLQSAASLLAAIQDDKLTLIKQDLDTQLSKLQNTPAVDNSALYNELIQLDNALQQLPLPATPLSPATASNLVLSPQLSWWQRGLAESWAALSKVVIVRRNKTGALPLALPEEKTYLYLNLHMETQAAIWALLQRNNTVYQASLARIVIWVNTYFVPDALETKKALADLATLQKTDMTPPTINLNDLLPLFDAYLSAKSS